MSKGRIDFDALGSSLLSRAEHLLSLWVPGGRMEGREYVAGSVLGGEGQSFKFNVEKGIGQDFATGQRFGDLIDVYAAVRGISIGDAVKELADIEMPAAKKPQPKKQIMFGLPPADSVPNFEVRIDGSFYKPSRVWTYRQRNGDPMFHVARYDVNGKKQFRPFSWTDDGWVNKMWEKLRPLYGLEQEPTPKNMQRALVVEGEKAADAARVFAGEKYMVVTWLGGSNAVAKSDWSSLYGKDVLLWPDADAPGVKAMEKIAEELRGRCPSIKMLRVDDMPDGFDAADSGFDWDSFVAWGRPRAMVLSVPEPEPDIPRDEDDPGPQPPPEEERLPVPGLPRAPEVSIDDLLTVLPHWRHTKTTSIPLGTIENLAALLRFVGVIVRYNVIAKAEEILIPGQAYSVDNESNAALSWITSLQVQIGMSTANTKDFITHIADSNPYNPVAVWIESKPWDGKSRLHELYATIRARGESDPAVAALKNTLIRRWMVSAVAGAFSPRGVSAHGVLVLQGEQYIGKTAWVKSLAPRDLGVVADGKILKPDDKDSVNQIVRYWIVELGELDATFRKADIAQLKAFITKDTDMFRKAYAARESMFARRTVFFASVNQAEFLHDETGNRRFWTIECESIVYDHSVDMQQVWAEVLDLYRSGESWFLTRDEMTQLNTSNEAFMAKDPIEEMVASRLDWSQAETLWAWRTATDVLLDFDLKNPSQVQKKKATQEIKKINGGRYRRSNGHNLVFVPRRVIDVSRMGVVLPLIPDDPSLKKPWDKL